MPDEFIDSLTITDVSYKTEHYEELDLYDKEIHFSINNIPLFLELQFINNSWYPDGVYHKELDPKQCCTLCGRRPYFRSPCHTFKGSRVDYLFEKLFHHPSVRLKLLFDGIKIEGQDINEGD